MEQSGWVILGLVSAVLMALTVHTALFWWRMGRLEGKIDALKGPTPQSEERASALESRVSKLEAQVSELHRREMR